MTRRPLTPVRLAVGLVAAAATCGSVMPPASAAEPLPAVTTKIATASASTSGAGGAQQLTVASQAASPSTVKGPTTPTIDVPGDNEPALVLGGLGVAAAALAGAFVVARRRVTDDPR